MLGKISRESARELWQGAVIRAVEACIVPRAGPLSWIVRRLRARDLAILAPHFDAGFYLRTIRSPARRRRAGRDPLLHYYLIGWRERRAPNPRFDARFYRSDVCADTLVGEPLLHLLATAHVGAVPQNEVEASAPRVEARREAGRSAMIFHHARGGGSAEFIALFETELRRDGIMPRRLRLVTHSDRLVIWTHDDGRHETIDIVDAPERLAQIAEDAGITHVIVNHFIDFHASMPRLATRLAKGIGAPLWVMLHDYFAVCPRVTLVDSGGDACALDTMELCARCRAQPPAEAAGRDPATWRRETIGFLEAADRLIVPSDDMRTRMARFTRARIEVWTPEVDQGYGPVRQPALAPDEPIRIAVLGSMNVAKGSGVVLGLAREIRRRDAPIELTIIGYAENARDLKHAGVAMTGRYRPADLSQLIAAAAPHVILLPFIWPETWSFALTNALKARIPVALFAHGAPAERLARLGLDELVMPLDWIDKPIELMTFFLDLRRRAITGEAVAPRDASCYARSGVRS